jgi:hypothetical protein
LLNLSQVCTQGSLDGGCINLPPQWAAAASISAPVSSCECLNETSIPGLQGAAGGLPSSSSSSSSAGVAVTQGCYGDSAGYIGPLLRRTVRFGNSLSTPISSKAFFAAFNYMVQGFKCAEAGGALGIMGMAYQSLNSVGAPTPFEELVASKIVDNIFALCMSNTNVPFFPNTPVPAGQAGQLVLGSAGGAWMMASPPVWTPIVQQNYYTVTVVDVVVGNISLTVDWPGLTLASFNPGPSIVDCGTDNIILPLPVFNAINELLGGLLETGYTTLPLPSSLPDLTFVLGGSTCWNVSSSGTDVPSVFSGSYFGGSTTTTSSLLGFSMAWQASFVFMEVANLFQATGGQPTFGGMVLPNASGWLIADALVSSDCQSTSLVCGSAVYAYVEAPYPSPFPNAMALPWVDVTGYLVVGGASITFSAVPCAATPTSLFPEPQVALVLTPSDYMTPDPAYGLALTRFSTNSSSPGTILGQPLFNMFHVIFDRQNNRVGFAEQGNCNQPPASPSSAGTPAPAATSTTSSTGTGTTHHTTAASGIVSTPSMITLSAQTTNSNNPTPSMAPHNPAAYSPDLYIPLSFQNGEPSVNISIGGQLFLVNVDTGMCV